MKILFSLFVFIVCAFNVHASGVFTPQEGVHGHGLYSYLSFWQDDSGKVSIDEILQGKSGEFIPNDRRTPRFGHYSGAVWGKFVWNPGESKVKEWYLVFDTAKLEYVSLYSVNFTGKYKSLHFNVHKPFEERLVKNKKIIFPLESSAQKQTVYFQARTKELMELPVLIMSRDELDQKNYKDTILSGLYYGIVIIMLLYNFSIFLNVRDKSYLYYVIYLLTFVTIQAQIDGFSYEFFGGDHYYFFRDLPVYLGVVATLLALLFGAHYLDLHRIAPKVYRLYQIMMFFEMLPVVCMVFWGYRVGAVAILLMLFLTSVLQFVVGFIYSFQSKLALIYFIAWSFLLCGVALFALRLVDVYIPYLTMNALRWGNAAEVIVLSFGLAYRMRMLQNENQNLKYKTLHDRMFPHFLFNSLSSVVGIIQSGRTKKAEDILMNLSELYQFITYKSFQETVSLSKEIEFCKKYLEIMRARFDDMIRYRFFIQGEIDKMEVSPFTIQPLLENVIKHGFDGERPVHIDVQIHVSEKKEVLITVENDGLPVQEEGAYSETLSNITGRLEVFYNYVETGVKNQDGGGVLASLRFFGTKRSLIGGLPGGV